MTKTAYFAPVLLLICAACQPRSPELAGTATGFFVSPTQLLTDRHVFRNLGCKAVKAASPERNMQDAELELVGFPANREVDLALYRLKRGTFPAAPIVLHSFAGAPKSIAEANAEIVSFPSWDVWNPKAELKIVRTDAVALLNHRDLAKQMQIMIDEDGNVTRAPAGAAPLPTAQRIVLRADTSKLLLLYSTALRPGASGSPVVDKKGRLLGVTKGEVNSSIARDFGVAVDAADVASFMESHGIDAKTDDRMDVSRAQPDLSRNVVRLFCFG